MSHQVHYHQHGRAPIVLHVVKDHKDGTFDLGYTADGPAKIEGIRISETAGDGCATPLGVAAKASDKAKGKGKKPEAPTEPEKTPSPEAKDEVKPSEDPPVGGQEPPPDE